MSNGNTASKQVGDERIFKRVVQSQVNNAIGSCLRLIGRMVR